MANKMVDKYFDLILIFQKNYFPGRRPCGKWGYTMMFHGTFKIVQNIIENLSYTI
jgi:hypothetical protein